MDFLKRVFGDSEGYLGIVTISGRKRTEHWFEYPGEMTSITNKVKAWAKQASTNVYFYPALFSDSESSSSIVSSPVIAADLDMVSPELVSPRPDIVVESSAGRFQVYWLRKDHGSNLTPLSVSGTITGDTKLKRLASTRNWKYDNDPWVIREIDPESLDTYERVVARRNLDADSFHYLFRTDDHWSLARSCAMLGCTAQETFIVLRASQEALGRFPGDPEYIHPSVLYKDATDAVTASNIPSLLTDEEMRSKAARGDLDSFVERYVEWASGCTDSPRQYHVAGALMILSIVLSPKIRFPTSFGEFRCNLWFMILAQTTLTRKTTSMEMAVKLARCIDPDVVLSTNGTGEGIISALADRDGQSSLFHRDEISGFLTEANEKKYLSGILESLTRLYDGGSERRTLRRQTIEVNDPYLQIMCGGIKSKTIETLTSEHISSGFLPRFLVVTGRTRVEDMKPIGPPSEETTNLREELIDYLESLNKRYTQATPSRLRAVSGGTQSAAQLIYIKASDDAWQRMRKLESDTHDLGLNSESPDIFSPLYERCMNSIIKVAILLAADRAYREELEPILEVDDIVTAISYAHSWIESMYEIARGIEDKPTRDEMQVIRIEKFIREESDGVSRSTIMRRFRLSARQINEIEATLVGRGLVAISKVNNGTVYRAATAREA